MRNVGNIFNESVFCFSIFLLSFFFLLFCFYLEFDPPHTVILRIFPICLGDFVLSLFVIFDGACFLSLVVASVLITAVPSYVNIMNVLFVYFEGAC